MGRLIAKILAWLAILLGLALFLVLGYFVSDAFIKAYTVFAQHVCSLCKGYLRLVVFLAQMTEQYGFCSEVCKSCTNGSGFIV